MTVKPFTLSALLLLSMASQLVMAQKNMPNKASVPIQNEQGEVALLMETYHFEDAIKLLQKDINAAKRAKKPTGQLENDLQQAQLGANMLRGTEKVVIVDSLVVSRNTFLSAYHLSKDCGSIAPLEQLLPGLRKGDVGETAYLNDFGDRVIFSAPDTAGLLKLFAADKLGDKWSTPHQLEGMGETDDIQDYPYMMADGVTLYYAAQGNESLGGYDIFVTRYNNGTGEYVKAENVGMPFNSPANDYLMAIDETANIGWFVSDRNQPADKVCIYRFIPNESREVYDFFEENEESVRRLARIAAVAESHSDPKAVQDALRRIAEVQTAPGKENKEKVYFVINDEKVYTALKQFKKSQARKLAQEIMNYKTQLDEAENELDNLRMQYAKRRQQSIASDIQRLEQSTSELRSIIETSLKKMRKIELGAN